MKKVFLVKEHLFYRMKKNKIWIETPKKYRYVLDGEAIILELEIYDFNASFYEMLYKYCCYCENPSLRLIKLLEIGASNENI